MVSLFDYIYYRIYKFFKERDDKVPETKGSLILSLIQFFTLLDILVFIRMVDEFPLPKKIFVVPVIILLGALNWAKYERNGQPETFDSRWGNEAPNKKERNGWFIVLYLVISFLIPAVYGYLKYIDGKIVMLGFMGMETGISSLRP